MLILSSDLTVSVTNLITYLQKIFGYLDQTLAQSHYREVVWWDIFMEQELRFRLDLGQMAHFPAFIASKSFDLRNHHIPQMK